MSKTLPVLLAEQNQLEHMLAESGGEITAEIQALMGPLELALPEKIDAYQTAMLSLESRTEYFKARAEEFEAMAKTLESAQSRIRDYVKRTMGEQQITELAGNDFKFTLARSKPSVIINDESLIPPEYKREKVTVSVDKTKISEDLSMGVPVPGAHLQETHTLRASINKSSSKKLKGA